MVAAAETYGKAGGHAEVDTEHMFGFTAGSDIGEKGEVELEADSGGRFGKVSGSYTNVSTSFEAKFVLTDNFRISFGAVPSYYAIAGVRDLDDRHHGVLESVAIEMRYKLLDRTRSPFGLTVSVTPSRGFVDETSGARADQLGGGLLLIADRELVPGRVFTAINVGYDLARTRVYGAAETIRESVLAVGTAWAAQVGPGIYLGAELRHLSRYDGLGLDRYAGRAIYAGPTFYAVLADDWWISAAWNVQAWGASANEGGNLNLIDFERHQVRFRIGKHF